MSNTVYVTLSHQQLLRDQMGVIAHNIANATTTGFKGETQLFKEFLFRSPDGDQVSFVQSMGIKRDYTEGRMEHTGNDLDVAINGKGFFVVRGEEGETLTRQGHFGLDSTGTLITSNGLPVLNVDGQPIVIGRGARQIEIGRDGTVATDQAKIGRMKLVEVENEDLLERQGEGLYLYRGEEPPKVIPAAEAEVQQGSLEASNVNPILEMTRMIEVVRSYQTAQRMMDTETDLMRKAIQDITSVK